MEKSSWVGSVMKTNSVCKARERVEVEAACAKRGLVDQVLVQLLLRQHGFLFLPLLFLHIYCFSAVATFNLKTALPPAWCCPSAFPHMNSYPGVAGWTSWVLWSHFAGQMLPNIAQLQPCHCVQMASHGKVLYKQTHPPLLGAQDRAVILAPTAKVAQLLCHLICHLPLASCWQ